MKREVGMVVVAVIVAWALTGLAQNRTDPTAVTEQKDLAAFAMTVARTPDGVSMTCERGCAWDKLSFSLGSKAVGVNDRGMAGTAGNPEGEGKFLIRVGTGEKGFALTCDRGCAWKTLAVPAAATPVPIDSHGMVTRK